MDIPGEVVLARRALLDVFEALHDHASALVLVGAQAVYFHAPGGLAVPMFTTDADLALDSDVLATTPDIDATLQAAGYTSGSNPGSWESPLGVHVDLMTPPQGPGRHRTARLPGHGSATARQTPGLEIALADNAPHKIASFDELDARVIQVRVASPAALLIAKFAKLSERISSGKEHRILAKDAGDVLRLLRMNDASSIGERLAELSAEQHPHFVIAPLLDWFAAQVSATFSPLMGLTVDAALGTESDRDLREALGILGNNLVNSFLAARP